MPRAARKLVTIQVRVHPDLHKRILRRLGEMRKKDVMVRLSDAVRAVLEDGLR
jgi:hypothetical protein